MIKCNKNKILILISEKNCLPEHLSEIIGSNEEVNTKVIHFLKIDKLYNLI